MEEQWQESGGRARRQRPPRPPQMHPKAWVDTQIQFQKDLRVAKIEYNLVKKWYDEMFPAEEEIVDVSVSDDE